MTDVHRTTEGKVRSHVSLDRVDTSWLDDEMSKKLFYASCRLASLDDPELTRMTISVARKRIDFSDRRYIIKGKVAIVDDSVLAELDKNIEHLTLNEFEKNSDATEGVVYDGDDYVGMIYWGPDGSYIFHDNRIFHSLVDFFTKRQHGKIESSSKEKLE